MQGTENKRPSAPCSDWSQLVGKVASSAGLARSPRLRNLFLYLCERTWAGASDELREHTIGEAVFGRPLGYDTASENIVRVSVSQLRKRLEHYFAAEGASEPVVISIPKGRYSVEFLPRETSVPVAAEPPPPPIPDRPSRISLTRTLLLSSLLLSVAVFLAVLILRPWPPTSLSISPLERFWSGVFSPGRDTYVVVADSGFGLLQDVTGQSLSFEQYLGGAVPPSLPKDSAEPTGELIRRLSGRQYTSLSDASISFQLGQVCRSLSSRAVVRSARSINIRDLKTHNIVLLGSARSNPWVGLLRDRMNFFLDYEGQPPRGVVRNLKPAPGEPDAYRATARSGQPGDAYGLVAWLPNLDNTGSIVTLSGTNMEGTEAAAELLLSGASFAQLRARLGEPEAAAFPYFEVLIRARSQAGAGSGASIVAIRKTARR